MSEWVGGKEWWWVSEISRDESIPISDALSPDTLPLIDVGDTLRNSNLT